MGGWSWIGGYPGSVGLNRLCPLMLEDGPNALQLLEDCFTAVGWHATFDSVCQLSSRCYDPVPGCDGRVGDIFLILNTVAEIRVDLVSFIHIIHDP